MKQETKKILDYIKKLRSQSFECWTEDSIKGYLTALISIEEKIKKIT